MSSKKKPLIPRFFSKVKKTKGCWLWVAFRDRKGYGRINFYGSPRMAHRIMWEHIKGCDIPKGYFILHKCDNPACVKPAHLFLGTLADNNADMKRKGRLARGEMYPQAKLSNSAVKKILRDKRTQRKIAKDYGVHQSIISEVKNRKIWRHVNA